MHSSLEYHKGQSWLLCALAPVTLQREGLAVMHSDAYEIRRGLDVISSGACDIATLGLAVSQYTAFDLTKSTAGCDVLCCL